MELVPTPPKQVFKSFIDLGEEEEEEEEDEEQDWGGEEKETKRDYHFHDDQVSGTVHVVVTYIVT